MKKQIILLFAFLLLLTGCGASATTATDVTQATASFDSSVVSQKESSDVLTKSTISREMAVSAENSVPSETAVLSKVTSVPAESYEKESEKQKGNETQSFAFTDLSQAENDLANHWVLEYNAKEYPSVIICNTAKELRHSLTKQYGLSGEALNNCLAAYPETYFQNNSLLLLQLTKNHTGVQLLVDDISVTGQKMQLTFTVSDFQNGGTIMQDVLYHVEVQGKLDGVSEVNCSVTKVVGETISHTRYTVPLS